MEVSQAPSQRRAWQQSEHARAWATFPQFHTDYDYDWQARGLNTGVEILVRVANLSDNQETIAWKSSSERRTSLASWL